MASNETTVFQVTEQYDVIRRRKH